MPLHSTHIPAIANHFPVVDPVPAPIAPQPTPLRFSIELGIAYNKEQQSSVIYATFTKSSGSTKALKRIIQSVKNDIDEEYNPVRTHTELECNIAGIRQFTQALVNHVPANNPHALIRRIGKALVMGGEIRLVRELYEHYGIQIEHKNNTQHPSLIAL